MNKIYFISCFFVPMGRSESNRAFMAKYLCEEGWELEVVAGENYKSLLLSFQEDPSLLNVIPKNLKIHRFNGRPGWISYDLKKLLNISNNVRWHWVKEAEKSLQLSEKGIIFAVVPQLDDAVLGYRLATKYDCPLVLYYVDEDVEVGRETYDRADLIVCVTQHIKEALLKRYGPKNILVAENGYLQEMKIPGEVPSRDALRLVYAGSMTFRTGPEIFAQAYNLLAKKEPELAQKLHLDFYGPSNYYSFLFLKNYINQNVQFKGFLPIQELMKTLPNYDVALASTRGDISFTSKIYQYLNAGLPILTSSDDNCLKKFIEEKQIGFAASRDIPQLANKLKEIVEHRDQILSWRRNVIAIKSQYSFKNRIKEISQALRQKFEGSKGFLSSQTLGGTTQKP